MKRNCAPPENPKWAMRVCGEMNWLHYAWAGIPKGPSEVSMKLIANGMALRTC